MRIGMAWNKFKSLGFILADKYQKLEAKKAVLESDVFPVLLYRAYTKEWCGAPIASCTV
jgi:hypothetical protein